AHRHRALLHVQRIKLALRPGHEQSMHARIDQPIDHELPGGVVDALVFLEGRHECGYYSVEGAVQHGPMLSIPATMGLWNRSPMAVMPRVGPPSAARGPNWR